MQWYKAILSFSLILLSLVPSAEGWLGGACKDEIEIQNSSESNHQDEERDSCAPFCACACCRVPLSSVLVTYKAIGKNPSVTFKEEVVLNDSIVLFKIWQPPKA